MPAALQKIMLKINLIKTDIVLIVFLMIAITIWAFDLYELLVREKRADRLKMLQEDMKYVREKLSIQFGVISGIFKRLAPYMLSFLKWILHLVVKAVLLTGRILKWLFSALKEYFQQCEDLRHQIDPALTLTFEENLELLSVLPYDSPTFENASFERPFAAFYQVSAAGIAPRYKETAAEEFERVVSHRIRNFIAEKRKVKACIYIISATSTNLYFAVTYSEYGLARLSQIYPLNRKIQPPEPPALEEIVPEDNGDNASEGDDSLW